MENKEIISNLSTKLYGIGIFEINSKLIQIIFLKSILDDVKRYQNLEVDDLKVIFEYSQKFNENKIDRSLLYNTLNIVANINGIYESSLSMSIDAYRFYFEGNNQEKINNLLRQIELPFEYEKRKSLITDILQYSGINGGRYSFGMISSPTIANLASSILDVQKEDYVLNTFAGYSAFALNLPECNCIDGYDINVECNTISNMIKIMCGIYNLNINLGDFYIDSESLTEKYNKIFTDGPLALKLNIDETSYLYSKFLTKDSDIINILKTIDLLKKDGTAVITSPNKIFISVTKQCISLRQYLSNTGLKAIIALPSNVLYGSGVTINLLVIQKEYTGDILLINSNNDKLYDSTKAIKNITSTGIKKIKSIYDNFEVIEGVSCIKSRKELFGDGARPIQLQQYFYVEKKKTYRSIKDIDNDIQNIMNELISINK